MLSQDKINEVLTNHFLDWEYNTYEPRVPAYYNSSIEKVLAYDEYFSCLKDWDIDEIFYELKPDEELTEYEVKLIRATVKDGVNAYLNKNHKQIFACFNKIRIGA
jgi:hypothetical protein